MEIVVSYVFRFDREVLYSYMLNHVISHFAGFWSSDNRNHHIYM